MSSAFNPSHIPNLSMWLDGTDPLNNGLPPNNGDPLPFWHDKSSNAHIMTCQSMGTNPGIYYKAIHSEKGGLHFNKSIYSSGLTDISHESDVFIIMRFDPSVKDFNLCSLYDPTLEEYSSLRKVNSKWLTDSSSPIRQASAIVKEDTTQCIMLQWSVANSNYHIYKNGTRILFSNCFSYTPGGQVNFYLGTNAPDSANQYIGEIGEVIIYNSPLDTKSRQLVEVYLAWKWNITLPDTNPYFKNNYLV
jgi:hypothetical protein